MKQAPFVSQPQSAQREQLRALLSQVEDRQAFVYLRSLYADVNARAEVLGEGVQSGVASTEAMEASSPQPPRWRTPENLPIGPPIGFRAFRFVMRSGDSIVYNDRLAFLDDQNQAANPTFKTLVTKSAALFRGKTAVCSEPKKVTELDLPYTLLIGRHESDIAAYKQSLTPDIQLPCSASVRVRFQR